MVHLTVQQGDFGVVLYRVFRRVCVCVLDAYVCIFLHGTFEIWCSRIYHGIENSRFFMSFYGGKKKNQINSEEKNGLFWICKISRFETQLRREKVFNENKRGRAPRILNVHLYRTTRFPLLELFFQDRFPAYIASFFSPRETRNLLVFQQNVSFTKKKSEENALKRLLLPILNPIVSRNHWLS